MTPPEKAGEGPGHDTVKIVLTVQRGGKYFYVDGNTGCGHDTDCSCTRDLLNKTLSSHGWAGPFEIQAMIKEIYSTGSLDLKTGSKVNFMESGVFKKVREDAERLAVVLRDQKKKCHRHSGGDECCGCGPIDDALSAHESMKGEKK